jgi:hypothetical protein
MKKNKINPIAFNNSRLSSSCDDFLSEIPDNRTQLDTPEKYQKY